MVLEAASVADWIDHIVLWSEKMDIATARELFHVTEVLRGEKPSPMGQQRVPRICPHCGTRHRPRCSGPKRLRVQP